VISVLCPSRGRPEALARTVASLRDLADHPDRVEVIVRIDHDDPEIERYLLAADPAEAIVVGDPLGYAGLGAYYDDCAREAAGDWLLMWNDDVLMKTAGWDTVIEAHTGRFVCLGPQTEPHGQAFTIIPAVPASWFEVVGHLSLNAQADFWLMDIAKELGIFEWVDVHTLHDRADVTGNNDDATYAARDYQSTAYYGPECTAQRAADVELLRAWLALQPA